MKYERSTDWLSTEKDEQLQFHIHQDVQNERFSFNLKGNHKGLPLQFKELRVGLPGHLPLIW
ncbi:MAG: hypothetical protein DRR19_00845 [Candidatus Parabeggiatoa sp. nov. 1]|nr:MAG: hypothetical protein DRR19_00845 [Gammaproteobacteria bacterium]